MVLRTNWFRVLFICCLCIIAYSSSLSNDFLLDDYVELMGPGGVSHKSVSDLFLYSRGQFYRPLGPLFSKLCFQLFGQHPFGYHVANLCLFLLVVIFVYIFVMLLSAHRDIAFLAALLYGLHPLHGMLVNYITASSISLYVLFLLISSILFILVVRHERYRICYYFSLVFFAMALLTHEVAMLFPIYLVLYLIFLSDYRAKKIVLAVFPFFFLLGIYYFFRSISYSFHSPESGIWTMWPHVGIYLASLARLIIWYLNKLIYPKNVLLLWSDYIPYETSSDGGQTQLIFGSEPWASSIIPIIFVGVLVMGAICLIIFKWSKGLKGFACASFLLGLCIPAYAGFVYFPRVYPMIEPHWFYFYSIGFFILISFGFIQIRGRSKLLSTLGVLLLLSFFVVQIEMHNSRWKDQETYCRYWISLNKYNATPFYGLGKVYLERKDAQKAIDYFKEALNAGKSFNVRLSSDLAYAEFLNGNTERALKLIGLSLSYDPSYPVTYYYLGQIFLKLGQIDDAKEAYRRAVYLYPQNKEYRDMFNLIKRIQKKAF